MPIDTDELRRRTEWFRSGSELAPVRDALKFLGHDPDETFLVDEHEENEASHGVLVSRDEHVFEFELFWAYAVKPEERDHSLHWEDHTEKWRERRPFYMFDDVDAVTQLIRSGDISL